MLHSELSALEPGPIHMKTTVACCAADGPLVLSLFINKSRNGAAMNGVCIGLGARASIAVDFWRRRGSEDVVACFLTHLHADHTAGLSDGWSGAPLFCSPDTRALMRERWPALAGRARALEVGETAALQLRCRNGGGLRLRVTPLDACHCLVRARRARAF